MTAVSLHVKDLKKAKDWYLGLPGAVLEFEHAGYASIRFGTAHVNLVPLEREEKFHIELGTDDLATLQQELERIGIQAYGPQPPEWGQRGIIIRDPDGNLVEFDDHLR